MSSMDLVVYKLPSEKNLGINLKYTTTDSIQTLTLIFKT